jgi:hypothetical protein
MCWYGKILYFTFLFSLFVFASAAGQYFSILTGPEDPLIFRLYILHWTLTLYWLSVLCFSVLFVFVLCLVYNVVLVSGLSILDSTSVFSYIYCMCWYGKILYFTFLFSLFVFASAAGQYFSILTGPDQYNVFFRILS